MRTNSKCPEAWGRIVFVALAVGWVSAAFPQDKPFLDTNKKPLSERLVTKKGDKINVKLADPCTYTQIKFEEKERHSRIYEDIHELFGVLKPKGASELRQCPDETFSHTLNYARSKLTLTAISRDEKKTETMTLITGPKEHLYLGLDLPVTKSKELKYDSSTRTLQPQDSKPQLYLSINWYVGDLAAKQETLSTLRDAIALDRISFKLFLLPNTRPLDSYGLGIGYQLPKLQAADLSAISVFGARFWTKQDAISSNGAAETNHSSAQAWRVGVTYDIASGVKWLKSN